MIGALKRKGTALKSGKPGQRFQASYDRALRERKKRSPLVRFLSLGFAIVALALGVALMVLPGPAFVFLGLAGVLFAGESRHVAQGLDWLELRGRELVAWGRRRWRSLSLPGRIGVALLGALGAAGALALAVWIFFLRE